MSQEGRKPQLPKPTGFQLKPRIPGESVGRGRALSLPNLPRLPSPGVHLKRREVSQPSETLHSTAAENEIAAKMAPPTAKEKLL